MALTINDFTPTLLKYRHSGTLTPEESSELTLNIIELVSDGEIDAFLLKFLSRFLTKDFYSEITTERNINKLCGYPLCSLSPERKSGNMALFPYLGHFCSKTHFQSSEFYKVQLSDEALFSRKDINISGYGMPQYEGSIRLLEETKEDDEVLSVIHGLDKVHVNDHDRETADLANTFGEIRIIEKNL